MCVAPKHATIKILGKIMSVFCSIMASVKALHSQNVICRAEKRCNLNFTDIGIIHCKCEVKKEKALMSIIM